MYFRKIKVKFLRFTRDNPYFYIALCLLASAFLLDMFIEITESTLLKQNMLTFDHLVITAVQSLMRPSITRWALVITDSGSAKFYLIFSALLVIYWLLRKHWTKAFILVACIGGAGVLNVLLKHLFARSRPDFFPVIMETGYSFPSGHAMGALCFYGLLAFFLSLKLNRGAARLLIYSLAAVYILLIGVSRVYLGVHYPSDVLAGYIAGSTWLFFCLSLYFILTMRKKQSDLETDRS